MVGCTYRHKKGGEYTVTGIVTHTEDEERLVVYERSEDKSMWARPLEMFMDGRFEVVEPTW